VACTSLFTLKSKREVAARAWGLLGLVLRDSRLAGGFSEASGALA
jgi:hypothetical protein